MATSSLLYQAENAGPKKSTPNQSPLSFDATQIFREELIVKNLKPYKIEGINSEPQGTVVYQQSLPDLSATEVLFNVDTLGFTPIFKNLNPDATIIPSTYTAFNILKSNNPSGDNGSLSQDSYLAKIGSQVLKKSLLETKSFYLEQELNNKNSISFKITTPTQNDTFESKLEGAYTPTSSIPGDYFLDGFNKRTTDTLGEAINLIAGRSTLVGGVFNGSLTRAITPSQLFLQNTDDGQKGILFSNISYNIFRPAYGDSIALGIGGNLLTTGINNLLDNFGLQLPGAYYVGSSVSEPSFATSPINAVPIDVFGRDTQSIVYGPDVLGKDYEGNEGRIKFGLASKPLINQGSIEGDLIWVSPKYKGGNDQLWSTNIDFKPGSILDDTQRLIKAADTLQGEARLRHVGNAINQTSKIFNDGYKQITKGSQVKSVTYTDGRAIVGEEYCRIFTKDRPYRNHSDLQITDGIVDFGRRFSNSVLNKSYNLNIYPSKSPPKQSWEGENNVKKYMFSIENLAWKDSKRPGYSVQDLPLCERGPNGGRIMWFAPYGLKFNDNSTANWQDTTFLGRPEPIYTYKSTSRNGTLSWKIVVDHPSVLNLIVDKVLANEIDSNADQVLDSFFAGCQQYDLYELAAKFNTASINDIQSLQEVFLRATPEEQLTIVTEIPKTTTETTNAETSNQTPPTPPNFDGFVGVGFYFDNDVPKSGSDSYLNTYNSYISKKETYLNNTIEPNKDSITIFFNDIIENNFDKIQNNESGLIKKIADAFKTNSIKDMSILFEGSASASASVQYNANLSQRRIESVKKYFEEFQIGSGDNIISVKEYIENGKLNINTEPAGELATNVTPIGNNGSSVTVAKCNENPIIGGKSITGPKSIYLTQSMACRSVRIKSISFTPADPVEVVTPPAQQKKEVAELPGPKQSIKPLPATEAKRIPGLSKKVLRMLLSECNYFQAIQQDTPFLYQSLKEKLKFFSPSFHSTTPEGLNSRLTFLNQCLRPGDTIPTIGNDGRPIYNDAINTAFGRPPVLVLRIGDFYNTKIIPRSIQFSYDPLVLDMNREGIGVQPMIADVTLSFDFIGGHGLARPIEELQNALSFNYYANTEVYDERATATEDVSELDAIIEKSIVERPPSTGTQTVQNTIQNSGGKTIGNILTTNSDGTNFSGTVDYREFLTTNNDTLQDYFINVFETSKSISETYNFYLWQYINSNREFIEGDVTNNNTKLFGRPKNTDNIINKLSEDIITSINDGTNIIVSGFTQRGFQEPVIRQVKQRLVDFINKIAKPEISIGVTQQLQNILNKENALISNIGKINYIYSYYDGYIKNDGTPLVYNLTGQTISSFDDITPILSGVTTDLNDYYDLIRRNDIQIVFDFNSYESVNLIGNEGNITTQNEEKFFTIMSSYFVDDNKLRILSDYIFPNGNVISSVEVNTPEPPKNFFDMLVGLTNGGDNPINSRYKNTNKVLNKRIDNFSDNKDYRQKYEKYTKYRKIGNGKNLELIYSTTPTPPDSAKNELKKLYQSVPTGGDKFNGKIL
jgi:hypothetical protein